MKLTPKQKYKRLLRRQGKAKDIFYIDKYNISGMNKSSKDYQDKKEFRGLHKGKRIVRVGFDKDIMIDLLERLDYGVVELNVRKKGKNQLIVLKQYDTICVLAERLLPEIK